MKILCLNSLLLAIVLITVVQKQIALENLTANVTVVKESARTLKKKLNEDEDQFQKMFVEADEKRVGSLSIIVEVLLIFGGILILGFLLRNSCGLEIRKRLRRKQDFVEVYGQVRPSDTPRLQPSESETRIMTLK